VKSAAQKGLLLVWTVETGAMGSGEMTEDVVAVNCRLGLLSCVSTAENKPMSNVAKASIDDNKATNKLRWKVEK
jgi:hypothetical protein